MTINITPEIQEAYDTYLNEPVDTFFDGGTIRRRDTHPFKDSQFSGMVDFAAGFQAAQAARISGVTVAGEAPPSDAAILAIASSVGTPSGTGADTLVLFARALLAACAPRSVTGTPAPAAQWEPEFDACSAKQEQLAREFCAEIAGPRGQRGSPPDPVRLLEMAQALYEAERDALHPAGVTPSAKDQT